MSRHRVQVEPIPYWLDVERLLGPGDWEFDDALLGLRASAWLERDLAADLQARLRNIGLGGRLLRTQVSPPLKRRHDRAARTRDARRRRDTTPGFTHDGTRTDEEGRYSLTPEALALQIGRRYRDRSVVDAGCGVGGNAIGFARAGCQVLAIEQSAERLQMARHNARLYGVDDAIRFVHGDALAIVPEQGADVLFVDPPWGVDWNRSQTGARDLPLLADLLRFFRGSERYERLVAKVPPSFDPTSVEAATPSAVFGEAAGDRRRVKFVLIETR